MVLDGDVLRANDLFRRHGEESAGFHGGVVHDEHEHAAVNLANAGDDAGAGRAAPLFVHAVGCERAEFEETGPGID